APASAILPARRGEGGAAELLGIESVGRLLRRVLSFGKGARYRLGGEVVAESALIGGWLIVGFRHRSPRSGPRQAIYLRTPTGARVARGWLAADRRHLQIGRPML